MLRSNSKSPGLGWICGASLLVLLEVGCKPRATNSELESITDGTFRLGKTEHVSNGVYKLVEFKVCHMATGKCLNPFALYDDANDKALLRASFVEMDSIRFNEFEQQRVISSLTRSLAAGIDADRTVAENKINAAADVLASAQYHQKIAIGDFKDRTSKYLLLKNQFDQLSKRLDLLQNPDPQLVLRQQQDLQRFADDLAVKQLALTFLAPAGEPPAKDFDNMIIKKPAARPSHYAVNDTQGILCNCVNSSTRFYLQAISQRSRKELNGRTDGQDIIACADVREDPPECRRSLIDSTGGTRTYSNAECNCLYTIENGKNRKFTPAKGSSDTRLDCSLYYEDPDVCLLPDQLEAHNAAKAKYDAAYATWKTYQNRIDSATSAAASAKRKLSDYKAELARLDVEGKRDIAATKSRIDELKTEIPQVQKDIPRLQTTQDESITATLAAKKALDNGRDALRAVQTGDSKTAIDLVIYAQFNRGQRVLATAEGRAVFKDDWASSDGVDIQDKGTVPELIAAMAKAYQFKLSCMMWESPFESIGKAVEKFAPEYARTGCLETNEADNTDQKLLAASAYRDVELTPGTYARTVLANLVIKPVMRAVPAAQTPAKPTVAPAVNPQIPQAPVPVPPPPAPTYVRDPGFIIELKNGSQCKLDHCATGVCTNSAPNGACNGTVKIGIMSQTQFVLVDQKTQEVFFYKLKN